ncbi:MAG: hypothetical protein QOH68_2776 [Nocardioidaceae bacterium]|nr:hypothetical protein [Nocardioidaceae bacterium]
MTASDYTEYAIYQQREQAMNLRNERRRIALERQGARFAARRARSARGLPYVVRHRLSELFSDVPARG